MNPLSAEQTPQPVPGWMVLVGILPIPCTGARLSTTGLTTTLDGITVSNGRMKQHQALSMSLREPKMLQED